MKAIRGATTVNGDTGDEIKEAVKILLDKIFVSNKISCGEVTAILFSSTSDIRSYYPAKAAREAGYFSVPLFSSLEPEIEGSIKHCIRVLVLADIDGKAEHVYLNGAACLRKDLSEKLNIAIDGPAGSGKSTIAKILANKFDILYLDTGAMYRACALACINKKADVKNSEAVENVITDADITVKYENSTQVTLLDGQDVSEKIRTPEISMAASSVSAHNCVREKMVELQRKIAKQYSCVLDGRDIGTNVLPDAEFKFFLTASPEIRAERRMKENLLKGYNQSYKDVLNEIILRDEQDKMRKIAPLKKADDAIEIDTGNLSIDEVTQLIIKNIHGKI